MIAEGFDLEERSKDGRQAAHVAARAGELACLKALIKAGVELDARDGDGMTPAMRAVLDRRIECLMELAGAGCDLNARVVDVDPATGKPRNSDGCDAVMLAAMHGRADEMARLVALGARVDGRDHRGSTAAMMACLVSFPVGSGQKQCLKTLIEAGCDLDAVNVDGHTLAMCAASSGNVEALSMLVEIGADLDAKEAGGYSAIWLAGMNADAESLEILARGGCDIEVLDPSGCKLIDALRDELTWPREACVGALLAERARREGVEISGVAGAGSSRPGSKRPGL